MVELMTACVERWNQLGLGKEAQSGGCVYHAIAAAGAPQRCCYHNEEIEGIGYQLAHDGQN